MIRLFQYEGYEVKVSPEVLTLAPFKKIWQRDKSKDKHTALMELSFIYFFSDPRSDYQYLTDEEERLQAVKEGEGLPDKWIPDKDLKSTIEFYESFQPTAALLLQDTRVAVDKLRQKLRSIDLDDFDDHGKPIYTLNTITSTIKQVPELVKLLMEAERTIAEQGKQEATAKGAVNKTLTDDGFDNF